MTEVKLDITHLKDLSRVYAYLPWYPMVSSILRLQPNQFIPVVPDSYVYDDTAHGGATHVIVERHALRSPHPRTLKSCTLSWLSWTRSLNVDVLAGSLM